MANKNIVTKINLADVMMVDLNINQQIILEEIGIVYLHNITIALHKRYIGGITQRVPAAICGNNKKEIKKWAYSHKPHIFN